MSGDVTERMRHVLLCLSDLLDEARRAELPDSLVGELTSARLRFIDEFERRHPSFG
jgi:hypothetical protein